MLRPTPCACNPQVLYRSDTFFIHDPGSGHTFPASRKLVAGRFGELFAQCVERESGIWITFDDDIRANMARIAANRVRYEPMGMVAPDFLGHHLYSLWDHAKGKLVYVVFETHEAVVSHIDDIDGAPMSWPAMKHMDGTWSVDPAGGLLAGEAIRILQERGETVRGHRPEIQELKPIIAEVRKLDLSRFQPLNPQSAA